MPDADAPELTGYEIRTAVLHLIELAAAAEGRGLDSTVVPGKNPSFLRAYGWSDPTGPENYAADAAVLVKVVPILLRHRDEQRRRQRDAYLEALLRVLTHAYRLLQTDDAFGIRDLQNAVRSFRETFGVVPSDEQLLALTPDDLTIREDGGPAEAAKHAIVRAVSLSEGTIARIKRFPWPFDLVRRPFGRFVSRKARAKYASDIHEDLLRETDERSTYAWSDLKSVDEPTGRILDRRGEAFTRTVASSDTAFQAILADRLEAIGPIVEEKVVELRAGLIGILERCADALRGAELPASLEELLRDRLARMPDAEAVDVLDEEVERTIVEAAGPPPADIEVVSLRTRFLEAFAVGELLRRAGLPPSLEAVARRLLTSTPAGEEATLLDTPAEEWLRDAAGEAVRRELRELAEAGLTEEMDPLPRECDSA